MKKVLIPIFKINSFLKFKKIGVESVSLFLFSFLSQVSIILIKLQLKKNQLRLSHCKVTTTICVSDLGESP